jgi:predicted site-specific integrase-resolvase
MSDQAKKQQQLEAWRKYAERHDVSTRTLDRWVEDGILREPVRIRGRKYIPSNTEPRQDGDAAA